MVAEGSRLSATKGCLKCHSVDGSAHIGPTWLDLYRRTVHLANGATVVADEAYLTESMMDPRAKQVAGFDLVMPSSRETSSPPRQPPSSNTSSRCAPASSPRPWRCLFMLQPATVNSEPEPRPEPEPESEPHGPRRSYLVAETTVASWLNTRDHKRVGLMFLALLLLALFLGGVFAMIIRIELLTPDRTVIGPVAYNRLFTLHGIVMIFSSSSRRSPAPSATSWSR